MTRKEAKAQGLLRYFTGTACKHGHRAERFTSNGVCVECNDMHNQKRYGTVLALYREELGPNGELVEITAEELLA